MHPRKSLDLSFQKKIDLSLIIIYPTGIENTILSFFFTSRRGQALENPEGEVAQPEVQQLGVQTTVPSKSKYQTNIFQCPLEELKPKAIQSGRDHFGSIHRSIHASSVIFSFVCLILILLVMYKGEMISVVYPHCLWELIEHIKTCIFSALKIYPFFNLLLALNSKELFMNLQVLRPKVVELRQIYTKGKSLSFFDSRYVMILF